jgi:hypothetical protein
MTRAPSPCTSIRTIQNLFAKFYIQHSFLQNDLKKNDIFINLYPSKFQARSDENGIHITIDNNDFDLKKYNVSGHTYIYLTEELRKFTQIYLDIETEIKTIPGFNLKSSSKNILSFFFQANPNSLNYNSSLRLFTSRSCASDTIGNELLILPLDIQIKNLCDIISNAIEISKNWEPSSFQKFQVDHDFNPKRTVYAPSAQEAIDVDNWLHWSVPIPLGTQRHIVCPDTQKMLYYHHTI